MEGVRRTPTNVLVLESGRPNPVGQMTWQRALVLSIFSDEVRQAADRGEIISRVDEDGRAMPFIQVLAWQGEDSDPVIVHSGGGVEHLVPAVVCLTRPTRRRQKPIRYSFDAVYARDDGKCAYCGKDVPRHRATRDHVIPRCKGGKTCWENVVTCCEICNRKKANHTPSECGLTLLRQPVVPAPFAIFPKGGKHFSEEAKRFIK